jgi:hypothetical protein
VGAVVVVVVVGGAVPDLSKPLAALGGAVALETAGWLWVDAAADGDVVVVVVGVGAVVVGVVLAVFVCVPPSSGFGEALCGDGDVEVGALTDGDARENGLSSLGVCGTNPLARTELGTLGGRAGSKATETTIATMPKTEAAPIPFCRRRMFISNHIDCSVARSGTTI